MEGRPGEGDDPACGGDDAMQRVPGQRQPQGWLPGADREPEERQEGDGDPQRDGCVAMCDGPHLDGSLQGLGLKLKRPLVQATQQRC
jgi:hypothetical protein